MNTYPGRFAPARIRPIRCDVPTLAQDRDFRSATSAFKRAAKWVKNYGARLRKIARHIDSLVKHFDAETPQGQSLIQAALIRYKDDLRPYAEASAEKMVREVEKSNARDWRRMSAEIGRGIEKVVSSEAVAPVMARMRQEQVILITSLPVEASERVGRLVTEGLAKGQRASTVAEEIYKTGAVTRSRCDLIARTETGRAQTTLTMARAQNIGSTHFRWVTSGDADVRPSHRKLNGLTFRWDDPPECDPGHHALPGAIWNCRCWASPVLPDLD